MPNGTGYPQTGTPFLIHLNSNQMMLNLKGVILLCLAVAPLQGCKSLPEVPPVSATPTGVHEPGQFVWYDLATLNPDQAKSFYGELFGWEFETSNKGDIYTVAKRSGVPIAGIISLRKAKNKGEIHPQWLSYFSVSDVDAAADLAVQNGAVLDVKPFDLPNRGRVATIIDNRGGLVAMVTATGGDPPALEPEWNQFLWTELWTDDVAASTDFYQALTGYELENKNVADLGSYVIFKKGERKLSGMVKIPNERITPNWLPYIAVEDPAALEEKVIALGGQVLAGAVETSNGRAAIFADPSGAAFGVHRWPIDPETYPEASK
jgi:predicted enzyme related to lactoylglutathione lyase